MTLIEEMSTSTITCDECGESYEFLDDKETAACMPDGVLLAGNWYCEQNGCSYKYY